MCVCAGIKAGLSHSPVCGGGKERYVFFSFPHIGIDSNASEWASGVECCSPVWSR